MTDGTPVRRDGRLRAALSFNGVPPGVLVLLAGAWVLSLVTGELIDTTGAYLTAFGYVVSLGRIGLALAYIAPASRR